MASSSTLVDKLPQLQGLMKRDPDAYLDEFKLQLRNYEAELEIFRLKPSSNSKQFRELVSFLSHVAQCYPALMTKFPTELIALVTDHYPILQPEVRRTLVQNIILMRNRGLVDAIPLLRLCFELFRCHDKSLRELVFVHIVNDIRNMNMVRVNEKVNRAVQNFMYSMLSDDNPTAAKKSIDVMVSLYHKRVWTDARTVNVMASALTSKIPKVLVTAMKFFLGVSNVDNESSDDDDVPKKTQANQGFQAKMKGPSPHSKKTRARLRKARAMLKHSKHSSGAAAKAKELAVFPAIQLLHDPHGLAERMLQMLRSSKDRFEVRLIMMNLISRIIGQHKLLIMHFYSFVQRYLTAHQANVTQIMAYLVQVKAVANNFVTDKVTPEVIQVGLNGLREVFARTPLVLEEEGMEALVQDLVMYRKFRDKGVAASGRALMNIVRDLYPALLRRRDRGKDHDPSARPVEYGGGGPMTFIPGAQLLAEEEATTGRTVTGDDAWQVAESDSESADSDVNFVSDIEEDDLGLGDDGAPARRPHDRRKGKRRAHARQVKARLETTSAGGDGSDDDDDDDGDDALAVVDGGSSSSSSSSSKAGAGGGAGGGAGAQEDDTDDDGDDGDEDGGADEEVSEKAAEEEEKRRTAMAIKLVGQRILTPADYARMAELRDRAKLESRGTKRKRGRGGDASGAVQHEAAVVDVDPTDLEGRAARKRRAAQRRLAEATSDAHKWHLKQRGGGTTNAEKKRQKNYLMLRKSTEVQQKLKKSLAAQSRTIRSHLNKMERMGKRLKRRRG